MVANGYVHTYRSNAILTASPGQLVLMLYDGALNAMALAREAFGRPASDLRRFEVINHQLQKAQNILAELQSGLNFEAGGDLFQAVRGAPFKDNTAMIDERLQHFAQAHHPRDQPAIEHVHVERDAAFEIGLTEQLFHQHRGIDRAAFGREDNADVFGRFVVDVIK